MAVRMVSAACWSSIQTRVRGDIMSERLIAILLRLSIRERRLLAALFVFVLPLAIVFVLIIPANERQTQNRIAAGEARDLRDWVSARASEYQLLETLSPNLSEAGAGPIGISALEQSLVAAGLRESVNKLAAKNDDGVELLFEEVAFVDLTNWLAATEPTWGYVLEAFRIDASQNDGLVRAEFTLGLPR